MVLCLFNLYYHLNIAPRSDAFRSRNTSAEIDGTQGSRVPRGNVCCTRTASTPSLLPVLFSKQRPAYIVRSRIDAAPVVVSLAWRRDSRKESFIEKLEQHWVLYALSASSRAINKDQKSSCTRVCGRVPASY